MYGYRMSTFKEKESILDADKGPVLGQDRFGKPKIDIETMKRNYDDLFDEVVGFRNST